MLIKTTLRYHCTPISGAETQGWPQQLLVETWRNQNSKANEVKHTRKHTFTYDPVILPLGASSKRKGNIYPHKDLHTNVPSNFASNSQNLEMMQMAIYRKWINNSWYIHLVKYYLATKRKITIIQAISWMNPQMRMLFE